MERTRLDFTRLDDVFMNHRKLIEEAVIAFMNEYRISQCNLMVGVSGGVDSMALLTAIRRISPEFDCTVSAVHVNHGVRVASDEEEQMIRRFCKDISVPLFTRKLEWSSSHPVGTHKATEAELRALRYQVFEDALKKAQSRHLLLAHHADDQVETLIFRLVRGTTLSGVGGMRPIQFADGWYRLRPFLHLTKRALYEYAAQEDIPYMEDETNRTTEYTRNFIRNEVVPKLEIIQPRLSEVIARFSSIVQDEDQFLEDQAEGIIERCTEQNGQDEVRLFIPPFQEAPLPLQRRAIKIILYCLASESFTYIHMNRVMQLLDSESSSKLYLPGGISVQKEYETLLFSTRFEGSSEFRYSWNLTDGSKLSIMNGPYGYSRFTCQTWRPEMELKQSSMWSTVLPMETSDVEIASVHSSERISPLGMSGSKKMQDVFTDKKVRKSMRLNWPGLYVDDTLVWVPGLVRSSACLVSADAECGWLIQLREV